LSDAAIARPANVASLSAVGLSALGIVFGDIGTSPLYTLKTVLGLTGGTPDPSVTLGVLSLVIWTLIVDRGDNDQICVRRDARRQ
jgi:KUP system potassium uptake protein